MVLRTLKTGLSKNHFPRDQRKEMTDKLVQVLEELSEENLQVCQDHAETAITHVTAEGFLDQLITAPIPHPERNTGKYGVNALMTACEDSRNHIHSGMHMLQTAAKGLVDRVEKFQEILKWFDEHPDELVKWPFWYRSTYIIHIFSKRWKTNFHYLDPLLRGIHHKFHGTALPAILPPLPVTDLLQAATEKIHQMEALTDPTDGEESFLRSLKLFKKTVSANPHAYDFTSIPTGWNKFKEWVKSLPLPSTFGIRRWGSVLRTLCAQCYRSTYERMLEDGTLKNIHTGTIREVFTIPFTQEKKQNKDQVLPYLVVSGPKYVVKRYNNKKNLALLRTQGYFPVWFKLLDERWKDSIELRIRASRNVKKIIAHDVTLKTFRILPPQGRTKDVDVQLVFSGKPEAFIATRHLKKQLKVPTRDQVAVDVNRLGPYALVTSFNLPLPPDIQKVITRWKRVQQEIDKYQRYLDDPPNPSKLYAYKDQLRLHYRRKKNLRQTCHQLLANWLGQQLVSSGAQVLVMEDLQVHTYGTRNALAKAIESMPDDIGLYAREVLAVSLFTGHPCELVTLSPFNSSRLHVGCGGVLHRSVDSYDVAPCSRCKQKVNTHYNAALYLECQYLGLEYKTCLSTIQAVS